MSLPLLQTKFTIPPLRAKRVRRSQLLAQLHNAGERRLTLVSAPAGFGKTTLVSEWIDDLRLTSYELPKDSVGATDFVNPKPKTQNPKFAWLSLDEDDNDSARFLTYLIAALQTCQSTLGETVATLLITPPLPPLKSLLTLLLHDLATLPMPLLLVLDDYHVITTPSIHEALIFLIDHLPPMLHWVIISRGDLPLPLARWRVRDHLTEINAHDLRFTASETASFLQDVMQLALPLAAIAVLEARTEGWIAGLQMASLSLQNEENVADFVNSFSGSDRHIADYLLQEVFQRQPADLQQFLLRTALLNRLEAELCNALTGGNDGQQLLVRTEQANLFLLPLDHQRRWYRYHQLFADFLRTQLQATFPYEIPSFHRRAAAWYAKQGLVDDAIDHALAATDMVHAADLIASIAPTMLWASGQMTRLQRWLAALPGSLRQQRPDLRMVESWLLYLGGAGRSLDHQLDQLEVDLTTTPSAQPAQWAGHVYILRAERALIRGNMQQAGDYFQKAHPLLASYDTIGQGFVAHGQGLVAYVNGAMSTAAHAFARADELAVRTRNVALQKIVLYDLAVLRQAQGRLPEAETTLLQALQLEVQLEDRANPLGGAALLTLGMILYEQDRLEEAQTVFERSIIRWEQHTMPLMAHLGYVYLAQLQWAQGVGDSAQTMLRRGQ